jgi:hypothetical protein
MVSHVASDLTAIDEGTTVDTPETFAGNADPTSIEFMFLGEGGGLCIEVGDLRVLDSRVFQTTDTYTNSVS